MDIAIAERFQISHNLVWFSRQAFEAELSSSNQLERPDMSFSFKTTEDQWTDSTASRSFQEYDSDSTSVESSPDVSSSSTEHLIFDMDIDDDFLPEFTANHCKYFQAHSFK